MPRLIHSCKLCDYWTFFKANLARHKSEDHLYIQAFGGLISYTPDTPYSPSTIGGGKPPWPMPAARLRSAPPARPQATPAPYGTPST